MTVQRKLPRHMLAHKRLWFALLCLVVLVFAAFWHYRDDLFRSLYDPGEPFQTYQPPAPPDYALAQSWLARPDLAKDPLFSVGAADIFVVTPTVYLGGEHWNAPIDTPALRAQTEDEIVPNYVTPYSSTGRVFAPLYRHAALYAFLTNRDDAQRAQDFAYRDIQRAFEVFLEQNPPERPIVLIGHGQGGLHIQRLIQDYFAGPRARQLAAAYSVDHPAPFDALPDTVKPCRAETDTSCLVAFSAFTENEDIAARMAVSRTMVFKNADLASTEGRALICINPLLWSSAADYAPARLHKGSIAARGLGRDVSPAPNARQVGAQCVDGVLLIDKPKSWALRREKGFGARFKTPSYNLFAEDIRVNIIARTAAIIDKGDLPKRAPLFDDEGFVDVLSAPVTPVDPKAPVKKLSVD